MIQASWPVFWTFWLKQNFFQCYSNSKWFLCKMFSEIWKSNQKYKNVYHFDVSGIFIFSPLPTIRSCLHFILYGFSLLFLILGTLENIFNQSGHLKYGAFFAKGQTFVTGSKQKKLKFVPKYFWQLLEDWAKKNCCATTRFWVIGSKSWKIPKIDDIQQL